MTWLIFATNVVLTWAASTGPIVTGYKLYIGSSPGNYTQTVTLGNVTTTTQDVDVSTAKYFAVSAVNTWGESAKSNEVTAGKPQAPGSLVAVPQ
jgi:hypothetical protein